MASFSGFTPLHYAVVTGNKKMLETLLSYGADPLIANSCGLLPQAYASSKIAELLKEKEAQVSRSSQSFTHETTECNLHAAPACVSCGGDGVIIQFVHTYVLHTMHCCLTVPLLRCVHICLSLCSMLLSGYKGGWRSGGDFQLRSASVSVLWARRGPSAQSQPPFAGRS